MLIYIALSMMPIVLSPFFYGLNSTNDGFRNKIRRRFLIVSGIIVFLFFALRSQYVGSADSSHYYNMMSNAIYAGNWKEYFNPDGVEWGFQVFVFLSSRLFKSPQLIFATSAIVMVYGVCRFIYCNSRDVVFALTMYITLGLMTFDMQGMRQAMAMSICLLAYEYVKKRKIIPFILIIALAMSLHRTAAVFLLVYFLPIFTLSWKGVTLVSIVSAVSIFFSDIVIRVANNAFDSSYFTTVDSGGFIAVAIYVIIIAAALLFNKNHKNDKASSTALYLVIVGFVTYIMRYIGAQISERISFYFMFGQIVILPNTLDMLKRKERVIIKAIAYALMIGLFAYRLNGSELVPYRFFW